MTTVQLFFYLILPLSLSVAALIYGEAFRAQHIKIRSSPKGESPPVGESFGAEGTDYIVKLFAGDTPGFSLELAPEGLLKLTPNETEKMRYLINYQVWRRVIDRRNKSDEIRQKHGNTLVSTLRRIYGDNFAQGFRGDEKLRDVLDRLDLVSLCELVRDYEIGGLERVVREG
jgi:hypothetical protein